MTNRGTPTRIVLVEDDADVARSTRRVLSCVRNVIVDTCHDVRSAVRAIETSFDVLVSDFHLPDGTAIDVMSAAARANDNAPRIVMTGHTAWECATRSINEGGAYRVLGKPVSPEVLAATVADAIAVKRVRDDLARSVLDDRAAAVPAAMNDRERIVRALSRAIDRRVSGAAARADSIAIIGRAFAERLGLGTAVATTVELAILAHRIGSVALRDDESASLMPMVGAEILRRAGFPAEISRAVADSGDGGGSIAARILPIAARYLELTRGDTATHEDACTQLLADDELDAELVSVFVIQPESAWSIASANTIPFRPIVKSTS